jgi:hypothetical protein
MTWSAIAIVSGSCSTKLNGFDHGLRAYGFQQASRQSLVLAPWRRCLSLIIGLDLT